MTSMSTSWRECRVVLRDIPVCRNRDGKSPILLPMSRRGKRTTEPGYKNDNRQVVLRRTDYPGTDHNQYVYVLHCEECDNEYGANGSDIHQRKCPSCQGGKPGLPFE